MKFYCDQCSAKYSIPDEKVRGKVVKVRCKECGHVITVRGSRRRKTGTDGGGGQHVSSAPADSGPSKGVQWYYSHQGETFGPHPENELRKQYRSGEVPAASYVWREGFSDWKPAEDVEPFSEAIDRRDTAQPRHKTTGIGDDALEAVGPADEDEADEGSGGRRASGGSPESKRDAPRAPTGVDSDETREAGRPSTTEQGTGRAERLERLRNRLRSSFGEKGREEERKRSEAEETSTGSRTSSDRPDRSQNQNEPRGRTQAESQETSGSASEEIDISVERDGQPESAGESDSELAPTAESERPSEPDTGFDLPPAGSDRLPGEQQEEAEPAGDRNRRPPEADEATESADRNDEIQEHDGLFDGVDETSESSTPAAESPAKTDGEDTEIPTTPKLGDDEETSRSFGDSVSDSLLMQIDNIKKTDRASYVKWGGVAVALLAAIGGAWLYLYNPDASSSLFGETEQEESRTAIAGNEGGLQFQTYSDDEVVNFGEVEVPKSPEQGDEESAGGGGGGARADEAPSGSGGGNESESGGIGSSADDLFAEDDKGLEQALAQSNRQKAKAGGDSAGSGSGSTASRRGSQPAAAKADESETNDGEDGDPFESLNAIESPTREPSESANVEAPEDNIGKDDEPSTLSSQLSKERISRAIRNVSKSVGTCRQRHSRHGAPLDVGKVTIVFTVQRDGKVSKFQLNPNSVRETRFEKCLKARQSRWNFGPIPNAPQQMKAPFVLQ